MTQETITLPKLEGIDPDLEKEILGFLFALELIRRATGHGTIIIEVREGKAHEMKAEHMIRPKFLKPTAL